jgi:hypothetical protein
MRVRMKHLAIVAAIKHVLHTRAESQTACLSIRHALQLKHHAWQTMLTEWSNSD